jgi:hypothetical protein
VFSGAHVEISKEKWAEYFGDKSTHFHYEDSDGVWVKSFESALVWIAKGFGDAVDMEEDDTSTQFSLA